jgi:spermidine synthase
MGTVAVEVAAFRLLAPSFGSTQFITTNVLGVVLASLAAGYWAGGRLADARPRAEVFYLVSGAGGLALVALPWVADPVLAAARPALGRQDASLFLGTLAAMAALFAVPFVLLGMASPFAIRLLARGDERAGSRGGLVFALSTLGSLAGAYLPSLVTIPWIGTRATILLFGALVLASAAAGFAAERKKIAAVGALCVTALAGAAAAFPPRPARAAGILEERESEYHLSRVIRHESKKCNVLEINEGLSFHSIQFDDGRVPPGYWGALQPLPLLVPRADPLRVCILGLAAGTVASQYQRSYGEELDLRVDGVEIDGVLVELGRKYFALEESRLAIFLEDARTFLARHDARYSLVIGDAYRQPYIPPHLATREFFELVRERLVPGGIVALNVGAITEDSPVLLGIQNALAAAFGPLASIERFAVRNVDVPYINYVLMASSRPIRPRWESVDRPELAAIRASALPSWRTIERDPRAPTFTDDDSPLEWYTDVALFRYATRKR